MSLMLLLSQRKKICNPREATVRHAIVRNYDNRKQLNMGQQWRLKILLLS